MEHEKKKKPSTNLQKTYLDIHSQTVGKDTQKNCDLYNTMKWKSHDQPSLRLSADE